MNALESHNNESESLAINILINPIKAGSILERSHSNFQIQEVIKRGELISVEEGQALLKLK